MYSLRKCIWDLYHFFKVRLILANRLSRLPGLVNRLSSFQNHICLTACIKTPKCDSRASKTPVFKKRCDMNWIVFTKENVTISNFVGMCEDVCVLDTHPEQSKKWQKVDFSKSHIFSQHAQTVQNVILARARSSGEMLIFKNMRSIQWMVANNKNLEMSLWGGCIFHSDNMQTVAEGYRKNKVRGRITASALTRWVVAYLEDWCSRACWGVKVWILGLGLCLFWSFQAYLH